MVVPGIIFSILTFPGIILYALQQQLICWCLRIPVFEVTYFGFRHPAARVHHVPVQTKHFLVLSILPFFISTFLGILISIPSVLVVKVYGAGEFYDYIFIWLGISILAHSFPDFESWWACFISFLNKKITWPIKFVLAPFFTFFLLGGLCSFFWLNLFYGMVVIFSFPEFLVII